MPSGAGTKDDRMSNPTRSVLWKMSSGGACVCVCVCVCVSGGEKGGGEGKGCRRRR